MHTSTWLHGFWVGLHERTEVTISVKEAFSCKAFSKVQKGRGQRDSKNKTNCFLTTLSYFCVPKNKQSRIQTG